ncbi:MAG: YitT family protein [Bacteroidales bacterium]|nr:YitT family protein [Bacteroidales bacterium]
MLKAINWRQEFRDYFFITLGLLLYGTGCVIFQMPYNITTGGATGVGLVIYYATGLIEPQYTYYLINLVLIIFALWQLGWKYCVKTIFAFNMLTLIMTLWQQGVREFLVPMGYPLSLQGLPMILDEPFMACIIGAIFEGMGLALVFASNGSTGGTDIIASIINKHRNVSLGQVIMACDVIIISTILLTPTGNMEKAIYGYITLIVAGITLDYMIDRNRQSVQFFIISKKFDEIAKAISEQERGVTVLHGHGWYTGNQQSVLLVMTKRRESNTIFRLIHDVDPNAFVSQSKVIGVFGEGFDKMKISR